MITITHPATAIFIWLAIPAEEGGGGDGGTTLGGDVVPVLVPAGDDDGDGTGLVVVFELGLVTGPKGVTAVLKGTENGFLK